MQQASKIFRNPTFFATATAPDGGISTLLRTLGIPSSSYYVVVGKEYYSLMFQRHCQRNFQKPAGTLQLLLASLSENQLNQLAERHKLHDQPAARPLEIGGATRGRKGGAPGGRPLAL